MPATPAENLQAAMTSLQQRQQTGAGQDLAAIAMHFNPAGYAAPRENFRRFRDHFRGCPLFTCEVSFDGRFQLGCDWQIHATSANLLWQKEQLINWMVERLPAGFSKVAWVDADFLFLNPDWARLTSALLDQVPTCQCYSGIHYADENGRIGEAWPSSVFSLITTGSAQTGTCGGAWAARRELLQRHGMYAHGIVGAGDSCWLDAVQGIFDGKVTRRHPETINRHFRQWGQRLYADVAGRIGCVPGDVIHLYHGTMKNRRYSERHQMLNAAGFDPAADVRIGWNGLLEWCTPKPVLHRQMAEYFLARDEDAPAGQSQPFEMAVQAPAPTPVAPSQPAHGNAIIGCYFVTSPDPQRGHHHPGDTPELVQVWATSLQAASCRGVLLVDHDTPRLRAAFPHLELLRVPAVPANSHTNAWRWCQLVESLSRRPRAYVVATDVFDVEFRRFHWQLLEQSSRQLWIGIEETTIGSTDPAAAWLANRLEKTIGRQPAELHGKPMLNAGIVGGRGTAVAELAARMWGLLRDRGPVNETASDMAALNYLVHTRWPASMVWMQGAPLHSRFNRFETARQDVCIIHK